MFNFNSKLYTDVRIEKKFETAIQKTNYQLDDIIEATSEAAFIRVFNGELWYYASVDNLNDIQKTIDELYQKIPLGNSNDFACLNRLENNVAKEAKFANQAVTKIALDEKIKLLEKYEQIFSNNELVKFIIAKYSDNYLQHEFYSSRGTSIAYDSTFAGLSYTYVIMQNHKAFETVFQVSTMEFSKLMNKETEIISYLERSIAFLSHAKQVTPGYYPIVLSPIVSGVFAHESFGHKSEADFMINDEALKKEWYIGKEVATTKLSIVDDGELLHCGYTPYDDEGTKSKKTYLIKNGKLAGRLHNNETATLLQEELTANARATSCHYEPIVRMTNTYIENGSSTFDELIKDIKKGYYIYDLKHGSGMSQFTIAPLMAYEIIDGKLAEPVLINAIIGNVFETLNDILAVGNDLQLFSFVHAGCGKMDQIMLPVGFGGPSIKIKKMLVM